MVSYNYSLDFTWPFFVIDYCNDCDEGCLVFFLILRCVWESQIKVLATNEEQVTISHC